MIGGIYAGAISLLSSYWSHSMAKIYYLCPQERCERVKQLLMNKLHVINVAVWYMYHGSITGRRQSVHITTLQNTTTRDVDSLQELRELGPRYRS